MPWTLIPEILAVEVLPLLAMKKNKSYEILADVLDARRKDIFPSTVPLGRIGMLSTGDQPSPRMPAVKAFLNMEENKQSFYDGLIELGFV
jgi:hypothetical protein